MARAQGARAQMALALETTYGTPPVGGFTKMPFASTSLGAEQPLLNSELLGYGRDPLAPVKDAVTADGDVVVPLDAEAFGFWLKAAFGATADAVNPFSAKLNAALWTAKTVAEGGTGDLFYTMNKEAAGDDLGLTLQTGFVTKALLGLIGSDKFRLAVSPDGSTFYDGLIVDNANGIVDQPQLPRFKAWTNYDNYVGIGTWTKIGLNITDYNDQGCFDAGTNLFTAPVNGTYLFGASLLYKVNSSTSARMRGRLVLNGTTEIRGSMGELSGPHVSLATALWLQTMAPLSAGDTVELQGYFRAADGYFAADATTFWGAKIG